MIEFRSMQPYIGYIKSGNSEWIRRLCDQLLQLLCIRNIKKNSNYLRFKDTWNGSPNPWFRFDELNRYFVCVFGLFLPLSTFKKRWCLSIIIITCPLWMASWNRCNLTFFEWKILKQLFLKDCNTQWNFSITYVITVLMNEF